MIMMTVVANGLRSNLQYRVNKITKYQIEKLKGIGLGHATSQTQMRAAMGNAGLISHAGLISRRERAAARSRLEGPASTATSWPRLGGGTRVDRHGMAEAYSKHLRHGTSLFAACVDAAWYTPSIRSQRTKGALGQTARRYPFVKVTSLAPDP